MLYEVGTVTGVLNATTITGTGTLWANQLSNIAPGNVLVVYSAGAVDMYEIKLVVSNTSITTTRPITKAFAASKYGIMIAEVQSIAQFSNQLAATIAYNTKFTNDAQALWTGTGDVTLTKPDGTTIVLPSWGKISGDMLSKTATVDQNIASPVTFTRYIKAGQMPQSFNPTYSGLWMGWNRISGSGSADIINHRATGAGGFNFYETDGTTIVRTFAINQAGNVAALGTLGSVGDQSMQATTATPNLLLRFKNSSGVESAAIYAQTDVNVINIRWSGATYSMQGRADGFVSTPKGTIIATAMNTPAMVTSAVESIGNVPLTFRGADTASYDNPNNYSVGTWYGFSVVPTATDNITAANVKQGKPVFFVNARTGTAHILNNMYVGTTPVLKAGDYGLAGTANLLGTNAMTVLKTSGSGNYSCNQNTVDMPRSNVSYALDWSITSNDNGGHGVLIAKAIITQPSTFDESYRNILRNGVWQGWTKYWDTTSLPNPMQNGDFGIGGPAISMGNTYSMDDNTIPSGNYYSGANTAGTFPGGVKYGHLTVAREGSGISVRQMWTANTTATPWIRVYVSGTWSAWRQIWDNASLPSPMQNGDFGLGGNISVAITDVNAVTVNQFVRFGTNATGSPVPSRSWAGFHGGFDSGSRYQLMWEQGVNVTNLRTRTRSPQGVWGAWGVLTTDRSDAQYMAPAIPSPGTGRKYCKIAQQSANNTAARGMLFMVTQGRQYGEPGLDISYIYFCARGATTTALAANCLQHLKLGASSTSASGANNIFCGAVYNSTSAVWELWLSGNGYNAPRVDLIGNVEPGSYNGVSTNEELVWSATMPTGYVSIEEKKTWSEFNTTVDSNGFIKAASPIVKLYGNGASELNDESQGVTTQRLGVGAYVVKGALGFANEGWTVEIPQDINGNRLCFVETLEKANGDIYVDVFTRKFDIETGNVVAGTPTDIPEERWLDLRVAIPLPPEPQFDY